MDYESDAHETRIECHVGGGDAGYRRVLSVGGHGIGGGGILGGDIDGDGEKDDEIGRDRRYASVLWSKSFSNKNQQKWGSPTYEPRTWERKEKEEEKREAERAEEEEEEEQSLVKSRSGNDRPKASYDDKMFEFLKQRIDERS